MQAKYKKNFESFANPRDLIFSLKIEAKQVGVVTLLFKLKLNEFPFCQQYCQVFIIDEYFQEKYNIKSHSLSGSRIVGEAFIKSSSIL